MLKFGGCFADFRVGVGFDVVKSGNKRGKIKKIVFLFFSGSLGEIDVVRRG